MLEEAHYHLPVSLLSLSLTLLPLSLLFLLILSQGRDFYHVFTCMNVGVTRLVVMREVYLVINNF